jgi:hypothetical protein
MIATDLEHFSLRQRDRTDYLLVANDNVIGSAVSLIQTLTSESASNHGKLLGRNWDVRGVVGVCPHCSLLTNETETWASPNCTGESFNTRPRDSTSK